MRRRELIPQTITVLALACGLGAFEAASTGQWAWSFRLILLAGVFDGADGVLARRLAVAGPMGQQLDSLSDVVTFGAAPASRSSKASTVAGSNHPLRRATA